MIERTRSALAMGLGRRARRHEDGRSIRQGDLAKVRNHGRLQLARSCSTTALYVVDDSAKMFIFDPETGAHHRREEACQHDARHRCRGPDTARGRRQDLHACTGGGQWFVLKPTEKASEVVDKIRLSRRSLQRLADRLAWAYLHDDVGNDVLRRQARRQAARPIRFQPGPRKRPARTTKWPPSKSCRSMSC